MRNKYLFIKGLITCSFLLFFITNTQAQTNATSIKTGASFKWTVDQPTRKHPAIIESIIINGEEYDLFVAPSGYQLTELGPDGHSKNAINLNGAKQIKNSGPTPASTVNGYGSAAWNTAALAAFQDKNLNHYFTAKPNGADICDNFTLEEDINTKTQRQSLLYSPAIPSNQGAIVAITERNANNCYHIEVFGTTNTNNTEHSLGETFVKPYGSAKFGPGGTGVSGAVTKPSDGSDYWLSDRVVDTGGTLGIALFYLNEIAPTGSKITRVQLTAASSDHGDGKFFIVQSYATNSQTKIIWNQPFINGNVTDNNQVPVGSTYSNVGSGPSNGVLEFNADGTYTYTPNDNFTGIDTFEYQVCLPAPNTSLCDTATVTIIVKQGDSDYDGVTDDIDLDDDNDGIPDILESGGNNPDGDEDGDGIPNYKDTTDNGNTGDSSATNYTDADGNGIPDVYDTDGDGIANHLDLDGDNDGIADIVEAGGVDTNGDGVIDNPTDGDPTSMVDADNDGLADIYDNNVTGGTNGTPIANPDSDGDGISDAQDLDSDNDGIPDVVEAGGIDANGDGRIDGRIDDTTDNDNDGFADSVDGDVNGTTDDTKALIITGEDGNNDGVPDSYPNGDTDGDGLLDSKDLDADNDGIPDLIEAGGVDTNGDGRVDEDTDTDNDGLADIYDTNASDGPGTNGTNGNALVKTDATGTMVGGNNNTIDTDGDGIPNHLDLDSDNDGIVDIIEAGGTDANRDGKVDNIDATGKLTTDTDNDGFDDVVDGNVNGTDNSSNALITTGTDTNTDGIADTYTKGNADTDNLPNFLDIDADNDGIPDNIEAQTTADYIAPSGVGTAMADANNNGIDDKYEVGTVGITPTNTDNTDSPDYLDSDSDNDGIADIAENGNESNSLSGIDTDGDGLDDNFEGSNKNDPYDVNDEIDTPNASNLGDEDSDLDSGGDVDYRDFKDNDGDGVSDFFDLDDDNDGILDTDEGCGNLIINGDFELQDFSSTSEFPNGGTNSSGTFIGKTLNTNTLTGWNYTQNLDGWVGGQSPSWSPNTYANAYNGKQYIDVLGNNDKSDGGVSNILSQTFTTVPGNTYTLSFYWGEDIGHGTGQDVTLNVKVKDAGSSTIYDQTLKAKAEGTINGIVGPKKWYSFTTVFIATTTETSIEFQASPPVPGSIGIGASLDLVSVFANNCADTDGDGIPNSFDLDSDNDGIPDLVEAGGIDTDGNGVIDSINTNGTLVNDKDKDGLDDLYDTNVTGGTNGNAITNPDTDGDGIPDTLDLDADNDGIPDVIEAGGTDTNGDGKADGFVDTDNDGFNDKVDGDVGQDGTSENTANALILTGSDTDPTNTTPDGKPNSYIKGDSDKDNIPNHLDLDADNDGIPDVIEAGGTDVNGDGKADGFIDVDKDGFNDKVDGDPTNTLVFNDDTLVTNANPLIITGADNDNDGKPNSYPNGDSDGDQILDLLDLDADNDGIPDVIEAGGTDSNGDGRADNFKDTDKDGFNDVIDGDPTNSLINGIDTLVSGANPLLTTGVDSNNDGKPDTITTGDTDGDGIRDYLDLDSDNDGITDVIEAGGTDINRDGKADIDANGDNVADTFLDVDNDGFLDAVDADPTNALPLTTNKDADGTNTANALIITGLDKDPTNPTSPDGRPTSYLRGDADNDGKPTFLDIDADNDGIPDNIEGQSTAGYTPPTGTTIADTNNNGIDDVYETIGGYDGLGIVPENTDGADTPDYLDNDSDNDGVLDIAENGNTTHNVISGADTDGDGLFDIFDDNDDSSTNGATVNDGANGNNTVTTLTTLENSFKDEDNDFDPANPATGNLDYRDIKDNDNDGIADAVDLDDDNDGIPDLVENGGNNPDGDADGDGIPNYKDTENTKGTTGDGSTTDYTDTDNNGIPDVYDTDGDGVPNHFDLDADNDGITDIIEAGGVDTNNDGLVDNINTDGTLINDVDKDGLDDLYDADVTGGTNGTAITNPDTDGDGIADALDLDSDNDGISDIVEAGGIDTDGNGKIDDINADGTLVNDLDRDGLDDFYDVNSGTNTNTITNPDTDGDGISDAKDLDADNDGIPDVIEAGGTDVNGDGIADNFIDTDNDGFNDNVDGDVGQDGTSANTANALVVTANDGNNDGKPDSYTSGDTDNDGIPNHLDLDADNDGIADIVEAGGVDTDGNGKVDNINKDGTLKNDTDNDGLDDTVDGDIGNNLTSGTDTIVVNTNPLITTGSDNNKDGKPDSYPNGDKDEDGILDLLDLDADNDGIPDVIEAGGTDTNGDGIADGFIDTDNDGFNDKVDGDVGQDGVSENTANVLIVTGSDTDNNGKPNSYKTGDTDGDGILNHLDLDSDNDGIVDIIEAGGTDANRDGKVDNIDATGKLTTDTDNDGFDDVVDGSLSSSTPLIITGGDTDNNGKPNSYTKGDTDTDNIPNFLDIDADNDGIPDNVEGQTTAGYKAPTGIGSGVSGITDTNKNGVDDTYETIGGHDGFGVIPENTDGTDNPDYLDDDSDNDGVLDIVENGDTDNVASGNDLDKDGLDDAFDDNDDSAIAGSTVNDGLGNEDKVTNTGTLDTSLQDAFGDADLDINTGGDLDYRDKPDAANVMITQVYQFGAERWIEITNIGTTDIPANTIKIQLYKDKTGDQTGVTPDASYIVGTVLKAGKSVLFKKSTNSIISTSEIAADATVIINNDLTKLYGANDIITLSSASGIYSWANRYDVISNITNKTSVVRIDETLTTNTTYTPSEWVVFIDDAITPYQPVGTEKEDITAIVRHPQDPLISEIKESSTDANTLLGLHRIKKTTTKSDGTWDNGFPDRSRYVVVDEDFEHTGSRLSARKLEVATAKKLAVTNQLLVVTNDITLEGNIRLVGTSQLVQTHTKTTQISGVGKLLVEQNSEIDSKYRYGYMSSPVNHTGFTYTIKDVLKDGTTPLDATSPLGKTVAKNIKFVAGYDGAKTDPISLADYWIYTYSPASDGRSNWTHKYEDKAINRGDGFIFKGPGAVQNYTFIGTPNDGEFNTVAEIGANDDYLIGNPFPSAMNARKFMEDNVSSINQTLYFWEHHKSAIGEGKGIDGHIFGGYIGGYATLNLATGTAADSSIPSNKDNGTSGLGTAKYNEPKPYIAMAQGFFVEGNGTGGVIKFDNSQRAYVTEEGGINAESVFFKTNAKSSKTETKSNLLPIIKLGFEYKNAEDLFLHHQIAISFDKVNSFDFDNGYDSKVYETGKTDLYWKFPSDDNNYVIAGVQEISNELEVPLELTMDYTGQVNLMVDQIQNVSRDIYITDKLTGTSYNVKDKKATLTLAKGVYTDRFVLAFKEATVLGLNEDILSAQTSIYADNDNNNIIISKNQEVNIQKVELFDILGKKVSTWNINEQKPTYQLDIKKQIITGVYIVKMNTNKGTISKKVIIE
ncbi:T9SS type A sorting domain-containing protein [Polaribacter sp. Q13]|uniref:T9SS type A sorting domain-containing protein n=1 Tax=Polaribacter sp. Q13 TaxID=2806551 RepID=UPI001C0261FC|nr:T9SS type A sorting domain-containing protein [Polaribacter sp. Q13]QVY63993.1 T9SS type A sorting domain-containing protein [Polaribacter sp. Q13]